MKKAFIYLGLLTIISFYSVTLKHLFGTNFDDVFIGTVACFCLADYVDRNVE